MRFLIPLVLLVLAACAQDVYRPAKSSGDYGWRETEIETGRWRITFTASQYMSPGDVQDLALLRAAELTLSRGATWFTVVSSDVLKQDLNRGGAVYVGPQWRTFGGWLLVQDIGNGRMVATLEIVLGKGEKPANDPHTYDAQDVVNKIRPRLTTH